MTALNYSLPLPVLEIVFWVSAVGCIIAQYFILRAVFRITPITTGAHPVPAPRRATEIGWAILPALMLVGAFVSAWQLMHPPESPALEMRITPSAYTAPTPRT